MLGKIVATSAIMSMRAMCLTEKARPDEAMGIRNIEFARLWFCSGWLEFAMGVASISD